MGASTPRRSTPSQHQCWSTWPTRWSSPSWMCDGCEESGSVVVQTVTNISSAVTTKYGSEEA
eukprot:4206090-Heterocapsa_arctica.AAC.1